MDLGNYSSQSHVAQQSRRNKLRVQQNTQQILDYPSNLDQLNPNNAQISNLEYSNISYDPSLIPSELHNFTTNNSQLLSTHMPKDCGDQPNLIPWRSCDWGENYLGGDQNVYPIGEGSMRVTKAYDPPSSLYREPSFDLYQGAHGSNFTKISSQNSQKLYEELHYNPLHQNTLPLAEVCTEGLELASIIDQTNIHHWSRNLNSSTTSDLITQGLSLSLSPVYPKKTHLNQLPDDSAYPKGDSKSNYLNSTSTKSVVTSNSKIFGKTGPLGPFTGYATILNSSKFLGPAQLLLGDMCVVNESIMACTNEALKNRIFNEANGFGNFANVVDLTRVSSPGFNSSNESSGEIVRTRVVESFRPEYQQRKESLLFMQDEVNRRQKQYHQQMEMVVSSFESVSGLGATTPCISIAVNAISRNFCSLKNVISEQLKNICKALGDASTSTKGDVSSSRLKFIDKERIMKQKIVGGNLGFSEAHGWRPQRGLPERAVAVLRAWLFEHFLHPYPTDTDKHMLASQTGLSRDQVSNWFINARVRLWKPMVEEIHALETNSTEMSNSNPGINLYATSSSNKVVGCENYEDQLDHNMEKRPRMEYQNLGCTGLDTSFMGFMPNQRSRLGNNIGGLGPVSLTLGLRQSPEEMGPQQEEHEQQQHFGGQIIHHDFVG